ncbi:hypothetical protein KIN20_010732 [Parelaphostrongylus tenuis]|uniref:Amino acid transporter n=1 Tax=Parelaphostrongylus tenuis TaxID=148309 RepID=A0AAD5MA17_PARTN|nr:hypothetical protein KIN20_010724 [Parelaphostrongylus tenuis]KAJ1353952.1 hypothetical protein KIN20_010732 [Parelaphostrongylus tenuis]
MVMKFPGEVLMRMLTLISLPLVISSLISGITRTGAKETGKIGLMALTYYFVSTLVAIITGIILVLSIHPGDTKIKADLDINREEEGIRILNAALDFLRNALPDSIMAAAFVHAETKYVNVSRMKILSVNDSDDMNMLNNATYDYLKATLGYTDGVNLLGVVYEIHVNPCPHIETGTTRKRPDNTFSA